ncbi:MAG TPA: hypothetical protein VGS07_33255, partial [Thermoanaerobaculia bacterium]|nr:hypothetical protein [Thermoanaerobaculia bacterium]
MYWVNTPKPIKSVSRVPFGSVAAFRAMTPPSYRKKDTKYRLKRTVLDLRDIKDTREAAEIEDFHFRPQCPWRP